MSELEELNKQKEELEAQQTNLQNWISLKKNLSQKFKNPSEAFKGLIKENATELKVEDFNEYSKGLNLTELFKGETLNEESFIKIWEQWEFKYKSNQHKLQMVEEKIDMINILEAKDAKGIKVDPLKKKQLVSQIQSCENLEDLHKKLGEMVQNNQLKEEIIPSEGDVFSQFLAKKSQIQFNELSISKMQVKLSEIPQSGEQSDQKQKINQQLVESQIIVTGKVTLPKKSYLENQNSLLQKKGHYSNQSKTFIEQNPMKLLSPKNLRPKESYKSPQIISGQTNKYEENDNVRRSQKTKRLKGDLQHYIGELFQCEHQSKNPYEIQNKGLQGFNCKKNQRIPPFRIDMKPSESVESQNIQRKVQSIRNKLDEYSNNRIRRYSPQKPLGVLRQERQERQDISPDRRSPIRRNQSPYTPGNVRRLNVERLKREQEAEQQNSNKKPETQQQNQEEEDIPIKGLDRQKAFISD